MAGPAPPFVEISPPLLNSANPWATTEEDLRALYSCPSTGAVTTRTSLLKGFAHDDAKHQFLFFDTANQASVAAGRDSLGGSENASLNTLGYSPIPLQGYLDLIKSIVSEQHDQSKKKPFIISVTGTPNEVAEAYVLVATSQSSVGVPLAVEVNLSCPNIPGAPPPAYSGAALGSYVAAFGTAVASRPDIPRVPFGLKTPPYTHADEYTTLIDTLLASAAGSSAGVTPISFLTATNTLGSCLVLDPSTPPTTGSPALPGRGIGGMAGAPLHPLALGNVITLRRMLDARREQLGHVRVIGVGGVLDAAGYRRMRAAGAAAVGVGTGLGLKGTAIFGEIEKGLGASW